MLAFYFLLLSQIFLTASLPSSYKTQPVVKHSVTISSRASSLPVLTTVEITQKTSVRKKKAPNIPLSIPVSHQILVPSLHVIPIQHHIHADLNHIIGDDKVTIINQNVHGTNNSHALIPVLIPIHNFVPVRDLTVIPLHRIDAKITFNADDERARYRSPLGGYGAGWGFGGHGAGHGFHYAYG